jgi:hypothetical protein
MLATGIVTLSALTSQAEAGVIWTFEQDGPNVTAVVGGSFSVDVIGSPSTTTVTSESTAYQFLVLGFGESMSADVGSFIPIFSLIENPSAGTGFFGHVVNSLFWDRSLGDVLIAGTDVAGGGTVPSLTWNDTTLDTIFGGGFFDNGPVTAWTLDNGASTDTISFVAAAVPEPSSSFLIGLGAFGLLARRKR